jgi:hypothetical protein
MLFPAVIVQASRYDRRRPSCENTHVCEGMAAVDVPAYGLTSYCRAAYHGKRAA